MTGDETTTVWPARVAGTQIAHLALAQLLDGGDDGLALIYRAICSDPAEPALLLELVPEGAPIVWCGACSEWARRNDVELPQPPTADPFTG